VDCQNRGPAWGLFRFARRFACGGVRRNFARRHFSRHNAGLAWAFAGVCAVAAAILAGALGLSACTAPGAPEGKILIEFWDFPRLPAVQTWLNEAMARYMKLHPEVYIDFTRLSWSKGEERKDIAAFAGRPPDVAGAVLNLKYVEAGLLEPLDRYLDEPMPESELPKGLPASQKPLRWRDDIHPTILRSVQWDGKTWGFPWYKEGFVILLNTDIFAERGVALPPGGAWTWEEFVAAMQKLTFDRDGDGKIDVYGIGFNTGYEKWEAYPFLIGEGMKILSDDGRKMAIDSEATRRGIGRLLDLEYKYKVSLPGAGGIQDDTTWTAFSSPDRRLAATCQGLWALRAVEYQNQQREEERRRNPNAKGLPPPLNIAVVLFPRMPDRPQAMASYGVGSYMVFKRTNAPKRTEAAARFARWLTLEAGQEINREAGLLPSRKKFAALLADDPMYKCFWPYIPDAVSPPVHPAWRQLDQVISEQLQLALLREASVDKAVSTMGERCQLILDDYWKSHDAARKAARESGEARP